MAYLRSAKGPSFTLRMAHTGEVPTGIIIPRVGAARSRIGLTCSALVLAACAVRPPYLSPAGLTATFHQILAVAPTSTPLALPLSASPGPTLGPTGTPVAYVVQSGDTLIGIAFRHGLTLEALQAANPAIPPYALQQGQILVLPVLPGSAGLGLPVATPIPLNLGRATCYETPVGSRWCLLGVVNLGEVPAENVSAEVTLLGPGGQALASAVAVSPLNLLLGGDSLPLAAFFPPLEDQIEGVQAKLLTAESLPGWQERYLQVEVSEEQIEVESARLTVTGQVTLKGDVPARQARLVFVLYDQYAQPAGFRELSLPAGMAPGELVAFQIEAVALGGIVGDHRLYAEAKP